MADRHGTGRFMVYIDIEFSDEGTTLTESIISNALQTHIEELLQVINEPDTWVRIAGAYVASGRIYPTKYDPVDRRYATEPQQPLDKNTGALWAHDHKEELRRRPKGKVIYRVIGADDKGWGGVIVKRSSDGHYDDYSFAALQSMVVVDEATVVGQARINLGLDIGVEK